MPIATDIPVFPFRPNWKEPMVERVSFLTDVLRASKGAEQRRSLRETPRRSYEADFLLRGPERTFWDLFINKLGGGEVYAPIYWEVHALTTALVAGSTNRINFDTAYREWPYLGGKFAILIRDSALDFEVVKIASVDPNGVTLTAAVERPWPVGSKLLPLKRAVLDQVGDPAHKTSGVATVTAGIRFNESNPWTPQDDLSPIYASLPVFLDEPNWVEDLSVQMTKEIASLDTTIGRTYQVDKLGRVLLGQAHRWFLPGRQKLSAFRDMIYRHRGRVGAFWLPTFKADFRLVNSPGAGATQITVENVGFSYTGGPTSGREYIAIKHSTGTILRKILSVVPLTATTERLLLDLPLGLALSPGLVRRISFADVSRFDSDDFEIQHYGGADAHHDSSSMFRSFKNTRTSPSPVSFPIPEGIMEDTACGVRVGAWKMLVIASNDLSTNRAQVAYDDSGWAIAPGPFGNTKRFPEYPSPATALSANTGAWFRCRCPEGLRRVKIACDDVADVWYNGVKVGGTYPLGTTVVNLPAGLPGDDTNILAIRLIDTVGTFIYFYDNLYHRSTV